MFFFFFLIINLQTQLIKQLAKKKKTKQNKKTYHWIKKNKTNINIIVHSGGNIITKGRGSFGVLPSIPSLSHFLPKLGEIGFWWAQEAPPKSPPPQFSLPTKQSHKSIFPTIFHPPPNHPNTK